MSTDKGNRGEDRRLSAVYESLADERAPDYLNERVLQMASDSRTSYSRARIWMRPIALAATIGLCLAIVLEITRMPGVVTDLTGVPVSDDAAVGEMQPRLDDSPPSRSRTVSPTSAAPAGSRQDAARHSPAAPSAGDDDRVSREEFLPMDTTSPRDAEDIPQAASAVDTATPSQGKEPDERRADPGPGEELSSELAAAEPLDIDRVPANRSGQEGRAPVASFEATSLAAKGVRDASCPEAVRKEPESWLACIRELRENGQEQQADVEYEQFLRVFPDYADREPHK